MFKCDGGGLFKIKKSVADVLNAGDNTEDSKR